MYSSPSEHPRIDPIEREFISASIGHAVKYEEVIKAFFNYNVLRIANVFKLMSLCPGQPIPVFIFLRNLNLCNIKLISLFFFILK